VSRRREQGFTLIEVLVAVAILAVMMLIAYGTTSTTAKAKKGYEEVQDRYREVRVAMNRVVSDLSMAYVSQNEDRSVLEPRTFFVGESGGSADQVRFSTFAHTPLVANANESDQTIISYAIEADRDDRTRDNLMRRETRRLPTGDEKWDQTKASNDILLSGVKSFKCQYFDPLDREWKDSWSTQNTDGRAPRLPDRVRVTIVVENDLKEEVTFTTQVRIHLQEMLQSYAN
jgi:general secretion pathway protein J